jgi:asparagine synthetase A
MSKHNKYGTIYGELMSGDEMLAKGIPYNDWEIEETEKYIESLNEAGVINIVFDVEDDTFSSSMFFEIDKNTDLKKILLLITDKHPSEFGEETDNCFRMWFD